MAGILATSIDWYLPWRRNTYEHQNCPASTGHMQSFNRTHAKKSQVLTFPTATVHFLPLLQQCSCCHGRVHVSTTSSAVCMYVTIQYINAHRCTTHPPHSISIHNQNRLHTFSSLSGPFVARMLSFCSSCTISPEKRLSVRGMRTLGFT